MLEEVKEKVCAANLELFKKGVVIYTWGNVSEVDRSKNLMVIKPSGIAYEKLTADDMVVVDVATGAVIEGRWKPSTDTSTHLELYRAFSKIGSVAHTHSINATAFAQAGINIPALGTTHADYFCGDIPCTRELSEREILENYESNTGRSIIEAFRNLNLTPEKMPGILAKNHGVFTFGTNADDAVFNAVVLEKIAEIALKTLFLNDKSSISKHLIKKHFFRKHGFESYYGQV